MIHAMSIQAIHLTPFFLPVNNRVSCISIPVLADYLVNHCIFYLLYYIKSINTMDAPVYPFHIVATLPDRCPRWHICQGVVIVLSNRADGYIGVTFLGCSSFDELCKNMIKAAKLTGTCQACLQHIAPVIFIST